MACRSAPNPVRLRDFLPADVLAGLAHDRDRLLERFVDQGEPVPHRLLDLVELLERVRVDLAHDAIALVVRVLQDLLTLEARLVQNAFLRDEIFGTLASCIEDASGFLMRLSDDCLALANDPLGLLDLIWNGDPELVDQRQELVLLDHDLAVKRHALAETDQLLEAVEQIEDVDRGVVDRVGGLVWLSRRKEAVVLQRVNAGIAALVERLTRCLADTAWLEVNIFSHGRANRFCKAFRTWSGTSPSRLPPNDATSRIRLDETNECFEEVIRQTTSISGARWAFMWASLNSYSKSETARRPRTIVVAPRSRA